MSTQSGHPVLTELTDEVIAEWEAKLADLKTSAEDILSLGCESWEPCRKLAEDAAIEDDELFAECDESVVAPEGEKPFQVRRLTVYKTLNTGHLRRTGRIKYGVMVV